MSERYDLSAAIGDLDAVRGAMCKANAENARLREALREIFEECQNSGLPNEMVAMRVIERVEEFAFDALKERGDE